MKSPELGHLCGKPPGAQTCAILKLKKVFQPSVCIWFIAHWVMNSNVLLDKITMLPADVYGNGILKLVIWRDESLSQTDKPGHTTTRDFQKKKEMSQF